MNQKQYVCIDLKSFFASVECVERGLDPLNTNLVVADISRTEKTICLAVTPSLKAHGISGRARLFEVVSKVKEINYNRKRNSPLGRLIGSSVFDHELKTNTSLALDYITAVPRMAYYIDYSTKVYQVYLKYVAPEDIHVYSIDEVFIDLTPYLSFSKMTAREFTSMMVADVLKTTGITATAGIGTNLYLAKIAMDIEAKKTEPDENGARIAELDEMTYREKLWSHRPLTDFWRIGRGYSRKLEANGLYTMGDIARCSLGGENSYYNEDLLFKMFGVNAELLIDHAWGYEPCTLAEIKAYRPMANSIGTGQVLQNPYSCEKAELIVKEMTDLLVLDLVDKNLVTDQIVLTVGYDVENLQGKHNYTGEIVVDHYGRKIPKHAHGTANLKCQTSSTKLITDAVISLYRRIVDPTLTVRRINLTACKVVDERAVEKNTGIGEQLDLFTDYTELEKIRQKMIESLSREKNMQKALLGLKKKYGKNIVLKGMNLQADATAMSRNAQIGGHKA
ncbi:MAG: DNA methylase [Ruminococcaceae bacterium]|nr:DNA methylase [Oscillospiraceae bacterium]